MGWDDDQRNSEAPVGLLCCDEQYEYWYKETMTIGKFTMERTCREPRVANCVRESGCVGVFIALP